MKLWSEKKILKFLRNKTDDTFMIKEFFQDFTESVLPELIWNKNNSCIKCENIYDISSAQFLSSANAITRIYNTKIGLLWEKIANLSPVVFSPEINAGYKIPGVDIVVLYKNDLYYTQLKTQKNTLTGSQAGRVIKELTCYENHWFVACIKTRAKWTAPKNLNRLVGEKFWEKIEIDYETEILQNLIESVQTVESILK